MSDVVLSDWHAAPFALGEETVFAIGDVHGCDAELKAMLATIAEAARGVRNHKRLIYLGDMIDRGPSTLGVLRQWAEPAADRGVDQVDRLMGNHEQLVLLAMTGGPHAPKAETMWLSAAMGGGGVLEELRAAAGDSQGPLSASLLKTALGDAAFELFRTMKSHVAIGNTIFVHGGLDPGLDQAECLARPWQTFTDARWAWVHGEFLRWQGGFGGKLVVHGHTPPHLHRELTGQDDPHAFAFDRLGLDGGTTRTGIVTGAQIETGRYRIIRAIAAA